MSPPEQETGMEIREAMSQRAVQSTAAAAVAIIEELGESIVQAIGHGVKPDATTRESLHAYSDAATLSRGQVAVFRGRRPSEPAYVDADTAVKMAHAELDHLLERGAAASDVDVADAIYRLKIAVIELETSLRARGLAAQTHRGKRLPDTSPDTVERG